MQSTRTNITNCQSRGLEELALNIQVPLIHARRVLRVVIHSDELRRRRQRAGERIGKRRQRDERERVRRIEVITGRVSARVYRIEEHSKTRADRRLVIAERIVCKSDSGIEVSA